MMNNIKLSILSDIVISKRPDAVISKRPDGRYLVLTFVMDPVVQQLTGVLPSRLLLDPIVHWVLIDIITDV